MLNSEQAGQFERDGFVVIEEAFSLAEIAVVRNAIDAQVKAFDPSQHRSVFSTTDRDQGRDEVFFRSAETVEYFLEEGAVDAQGRLDRPLDRAINKLGHALHDHVPEIGTFCRQPAVAMAFRQLGLRSPQLWQTMVIFKQPGIGGEVRWHQDASYLHTTPSSVIGLWIALEDADRNNGCLLVAPGMHRQPLRERYRVDWSNRQGTLETIDESVQWPVAPGFTALEVKAGSAVFFSDHLPHASTANRSDRSRTAMTLHVADSESLWAGENWLQRPTLDRFLL
jgi:phytanoyl-CoA hydroxylase